ncbi:hypothetical protein HK105_207444 [Polyrhizophydium stewartii]|uniref:RmlD-like substrate binding domain-containing protein n=1 Tax=Polyrhizophydium stewartii TaxID=2732419 RepID=A0ABR4N0T2_9FUNG
MTRTIVITGASGLLGRAVYDAFAARSEFRVVGTAFSRAGKHARLDLTDAAAVEAFLVETKPAVVVHCAAERRPDVAARDEAGTVRLNVDVCGTLGQLATKVGAKVVFISSDYLFDGLSPPYEVDAVPNPLNFYGRTKLAGEQAILASNPHAISLRVPLLYGAVEYNAESSVSALIDLDSSKQVTVDHFQSRFPTCVEDVAKALVALIDRHFAGEPVEGIFHFSAKERMTKYEICSCVSRCDVNDQMFGELLGVSTAHVVPDSEPPKDPVATRPVDAQLSTARIEAIGIKIECVPFRTWYAAHLA